MFGELLENVRAVRPLIHNITNYVTANDCANILLACGASPTMTDDAAEVEEVTAKCGGLNINLGTLSQRTIPSMLAAGKKAKELGHPVLLDPVGVGSSAMRTNTALHLLQEISFDVIRGNISEIKTLALGSHSTQGVDANVEDQVTEENLPRTLEFVHSFTKRTGAVLVVTGALDLVVSAERAYVIENGHSLMGCITGSGCMLSALTAAYITANRDRKLLAAAAAVSAMGVCGEIAAERMGSLDGNASYRNYLIDAVFRLDGNTLEHRARYRVM